MQCIDKILYKLVPAGSLPRTRLYGRPDDAAGAPSAVGGPASRHGGAGERGGLSEGGAATGLAESGAGERSGTVAPPAEF